MEADKKLIRAQAIAAIFKYNPFAPSCILEPLSRDAAFVVRVSDNGIARLIAQCYEGLPCWHVFSKAGELTPEIRAQLDSFPMPGPRRRLRLTEALKLWWKGE